MPTVKLPVEFKIITCQQCSSPYAVTVHSTELCPHCAADILYKYWCDRTKERAEYMKETEALKRSISSLKGVITKKQNEINKFKIFGPPDPNAPKVPKHEPIPKEFDFKNPKFYDVVETHRGWAVCDYLRLNRGCPNEFEYGQCDAGSKKAYKLKPEYQHLDPRNKK